MLDNLIKLKEEYLKVSGKKGLCYTVDVCIRKGLGYSEKVKLIMYIRFNKPDYEDKGGLYWFNDVTNIKGRIEWLNKHIKIWENCNL